MADGNLLITSGMGVSPNNYLKYLAKLDRTDGATIWEHTYGSPCEGCPLFAGNEITSGGDLIAVGHTLVSGDAYYGTLLRTNNNGDSIWMRNYLYVDSLVSHGSGLLRDVLPTPEGGFIACGTALAVVQHGGQVYGQAVWVVKTDSMGCIEPGCHLVTGMESQITNLRNALRIAPNPVARGGTLSLELDLPAGFTPQGALQLTVVNGLGQLVATRPWGEGHERELSVGAWPSGLYHLHLSDASRWITGGKFVVE